MWIEIEGLGWVSVFPGTDPNVTLEQMKATVLKSLEEPLEIIEDLDADLVDNPPVTEKEKTRC